MMFDYSIIAVNNESDRRQTHQVVYRYSVLYVLTIVNATNISTKTLCARSAFNKKMEWTFFFLPPLT